MILFPILFYNVIPVILKLVHNITTVANSINIVISWLQYILFTSVESFVNITKNDLIDLICSILLQSKCILFGDL